MKKIILSLSIFLSGGLSKHKYTFRANSHTFPNGHTCTDIDPIYGNGSNHIHTNTLLSHLRR